MAFHGIYDEAKLRGWMEGVSPIAGFGLGSNLFDQTRAMLNLPFDHKAKLDAVLTKLQSDNPQMAQRYVQAVLGMSTSETRMQDFQTGVNVGAFPGLGTVGKGILRGVGLAEKAVGSVVQGSIDTGAGAIERAAGDTASGAVAQVTDQLKNEIAGKSNPIKTAQDQLLSGFKPMEPPLNPGQDPAIGQDLVNRINENRTTLSTNLWDSISKVAKVNRIPEVTAVKEAVESIMNKIREDYTGPSNSVANISMRYDKVANVHFFDTQITHEDGTLFFF